MFHTDSQTVLQWINSQTCKFDVFTGNRIGKIHRETDPTQWKHVAVTYNPADACSHGIDPTEVDSLVAYHQGPAFLLQDPTTWPTWEPTSQESPQKPTCCAVTEMDTENNCVDRLVNRISSKVRLERTMACCLRFVHNCRHRKEKSGDLTPDEMDAGLAAFIRRAKEIAFQKDLLLVRKKTYHCQAARM